MKNAVKNAVVLVLALAIFAAFCYGIGCLVQG